MIADSVRHLLLPLTLMRRKGVYTNEILWQFAGYTFNGLFYYVVDSQLVPRFPKVRDAYHRVTLQCSFSCKFVVKLRCIPIVLHDIALLGRYREMSVVSY